MSSVASARIEPPSDIGERGTEAPLVCPRPRTLAAVIATATLLAVGLRLYGLSRPGFLLGVNEYDEGTDFGSAIRLAHGAMPYRDFIMVHPPGITLLMYPLALATRAISTDTGLAMARVVTALASAAAVPLA